MGERKDTRFTDPDVHILRTDCYTRLRKAIENLSKLEFSKSTINTMILNFVPHLKRKDRDCGGLPFYSRQYTSAKPNKAHALVCLISMLVQVYWDINDGTIELEEKSDFATAELDRFEVNLATLEGIAASGLDAYRLHGKMPNIRLVTLQEVADLEAAETDTEDLKAERAECDKIEGEQQQASVDKAEAKGLMDAELGESHLSTELIEEPSSAKSEDETVTSDLDQSSSTDADQLSVEDADKCCSDCDNCTDRVCELDDKEADARAERLTDGVEEPPAELADIEGAEAKAAYAAGSVNDSEQYPDPEPLEQTIKTAQEVIPPMPDEEAEEQAAVDHETGADQVE